MNDSLLLTINGWAGHSSLLDNLMLFCAKYLIYIVFLAAAGCMLYSARQKQWQPILLFGTNLVVTFAVLLIAAHLYVDNRPFVDHPLHQLLPHAAGKSFPSDHTTATMAIGMGLLVFTKFKKIGAGIIACAITIGFARIFVGVHYPVDIAGGLLTGLVGSAITHGLWKLFDRLVISK